MRTLAIISNKKWFPGKQRVIAFFKEDLKAEIRFTENFSDIAGILRDNRDVESVICCGGDGTVSEVINNIDLKTQKLGVIPSGRGNGFARTLKINRSSTALKTIKKGVTRAVDLIKCEYRQNSKTFLRYAVSTIGAGRIALGAHIANQCPKKNYLFTSMLSAFDQEELEGEIRIGENAPNPVTTILAFIYFLSLQR